MWRETCSVRIAVVTGKVRPVIAVGTLDPALIAVIAGILVQALGVLVGTKIPQSRVSQNPHILIS